MKHDNHVTSFATILSCVNTAHVFIFTTCFGYSEPSSGEKHVVKIKTCSIYT
jgi:hypothetical protein